MVTLTRLAGSVFALNPDLIERVDCTPDTVITLVDGTKYLVRDSLTDVVDAVRRYRGSIIAEAHRFEVSHGVHTPSQPLSRAGGAGSAESADSVDSADGGTVVWLPRGEV